VVGIYETGASFEDTSAVSQRVAIARALANRPAIILAKERIAESSFFCYHDAQHHGPKI
jgi:ABC-type methionine transport system ATPase subunit